MTLFYRNGEPFSRPVRPVRWIAEEFVLIHSIVGRTQYDVLGCWRFELDEEEDGDGQFKLF